MAEQTIIELLSRLRSIDVRVWADNGQLRINAPDGALTPTLKAELKERKSEILAFLNAARDVAQTSVEIKPATRTGELPLSYSQQRLWLLDQLNPGSHVYIIPLVVRFVGSLDVPLLEKCINKIIERHEILRTTFAPNSAHQPIQVIAPSLSISILQLGLQDIPSEQKDSQTRRLILEASREPFDLTQGPLIRAKLLQVHETESILILTVHHIVSDAWSTGVLAIELTELYRAASANQPAQLLPLPIQYADFAVWQREWLQGSVLEGQLNYWKNQLDATLDEGILPADRPRNLVQTGQGMCQTFLWPRTLSDALNALSRQEGVSLFATLLAAFNILLHRYSGKNDISVGTFTANRNHAQIESLIGIFINVLVLRNGLGGNPVFRTFLKQVSQNTLQAYAHQDLPFDMLVEQLQTGRGKGAQPLFHALLVLQNAPLPKVELPNLTIERLLLEPEEVFPNSDLDLDFEETENGLLGILGYNTDLFEPATINQIIRHFQVLLEEIVANPDARISELSLLSKAEREQMLTWSNKVRWAEPQDKSVHELFEAQVKDTPDAVAVTFEDQQLTYAELDARANQLAHHLKNLGVKPDQLVGICLDRSFEMVIGILGILKAGGAYLPLDPKYPPDRLAFMLTDAQVNVIVAHSDLASQLPVQDMTIVYLDRDSEALNRESPEKPAVSLLPENLAYVIYTSGSTGKPKGTAISHANVTRLLAATQAWFNFGKDDVWTFFHSFAFDFSVWELWGALAYGGRLVMVPYMVSRAPELFHELLLAQDVTVLNQTPSAFRQLSQVATSTPKRESKLRWVIFGGEKLELSSLKPWFDVYGDQQPQLVNMYGITETTVHVTYRPISQADLEQANGSVIGIPIPDLQIYVLDTYLQPVPVGIPGEIYVGGAGLARGYLSRPALTAERFIPNPFSDLPGARLYKTGDLACYRASGELEYLGRIDQQVKIRGFRIELGEIEAALNQYPTVQDAVVLALDSASAEKNLVAYIVPKPGMACTAGDMRSFLQNRLPEYMTPAAFVMLESLPLTPNGKLDQKALPAPDGIRPEMEVEFVAPEGPVEEKLARIFAEVLGVERVGVFDNFFALGGHSLLATQVVYQINAMFSINLPMKNFFEQPIIANLALLIEEAVLDEIEKSENIGE